jgi:phosphoheptose isomerase
MRAMVEDAIRRIFSAAAAAQQRFVSRHAGTLARVIDVTVEALARRRTLFFFGNGGSAADAQHIAAELVGRFMDERRPLPAIALTTDTSALTAIANDYGYDAVFARQIEALGRAGDVAIEALGTPQTFESCLRVLRPGGVLSSLGVYSGKLTLPVDAFAAGLGDHRLVTTLCPGGKERMRRLMSVLSSGRVDLRPMVTHRFPLEAIADAYELFMHQKDGVLKVAITPHHE